MTHDGVGTGPGGHRLDRLTTVQASEAMQNASVALIPVGATEQHGPNLVCGIDYMTAEAVAERVAAEVDPKRLVFVDEMGLHTSLASLYGYSRKGERVHLMVPRNRGRNTTLVASITFSGMGETRWPLRALRPRESSRLT